MAKNNTSLLTDTPAYKLTNAIYRWCMISLLWALCSLPLITLGAASCAAMGEFSDPENHYGHKLVRDYFRRFRFCFVRSTGLWLMFVILLGLLALDLSFYRQFTGNTGWFLPALAVVLGNLLLGFVRFGCFTAVSQKDADFRSFLKCSGKTMLLCLPIWAVMVALDLAVITTLVQIPYLLFLLILLPGLFSDIHCKLIQMFLRRYEPEEA